MKQRLYQRGIVFALVILVMCFSFPITGFAEEDDLQVVKLQLRWDNQFQFAGYYAADWQGYYADEGIKVEIIPATKSDQSVVSSVKEVSEGRADFGIGSADILIANDRGADLRVVAVIMQRSAARYFLKEETKYTSLTDLTKLKVARNVNDLIDIELQAMLIKEGIDPNLVMAYPHQAGIDGLVSDNVQVVPGYELGTPYIANQKGIPIKEINPQDYGVDFYGDSLFVSGDLVDQNPELVEKFKRASLKGWEYAFNHSEEIATKISRDLVNYEQYGDLLNFNLYQAQIMKELAEYPIIDVGHINPYRWQKMIDFLKSDGLIKNEVDINELIFDPVKLNIEKEKQQKELLMKAGLVAVGLLILIVLWALFLKRAVKRKTEEIISVHSNLIDAERKYKLITDNASDVISVYNISKMKFTYISPSIFALRGFTAEESLHEKFEDSIAPDFVEFAKDTMAKNLDDFMNNPNTLNSYIDIVQQPCKSGDFIWVEISTKFRYNSEGDLEAVNISRNIEERKKAENALLQSEQRYKFIFEYAGMAAGFYKTDGTVISFNQKAAENMGGSAEDYAGKSLYEMFPKAAADLYMDRITKASKTDSSEEYIDFVSLEPGDKWFLSTFKRVADQAGKVIGIQIISQDITEQKQMDIQLRESEERFKLLFDHAPLGYQSLDIEGNFLEVNQKWLDMLGYQKEEVKGKWFGDFLAPGYKEAFRERFPIFKEQGFIHSEFEMVGKTGEVMFIAFDGKIGYASDGAFQQTHCILKDITMEKVLSKKLGETRNLMEAIINNTTDAIYVKDLEGKYLLANHAVEQVTGKPQIEIIGKDDYALFSAAEAEAIRVVDKEVCKGEGPKTFEEGGTDASGRFNAFSTTKGPIRDQDNKVIGLFGIARDITKQKQNEQNLIKSEEKYKSLVISMDQAMALHEIICDEKGKPVNYRFLAVNPAFEEMTGLKGEDIINRTVLEIMPATEVFWIQTYGTVALTGESKRFEQYSAVLDKYWAVSAYRPAQNQFACVFLDITERKKTEEVMVHLSYYDQLTGLYNRRFYEEELKRLDKERNLPITLVMSDVNGLKLTNDAFGHQAGDVLLQTIAELLKNECRSDEIISRIGGDEFVILLPKTDSETAKKLIQRIGNAINKAATQNALISLSIGYAVKDNMQKQFDEIFKDAEDDMYRHKLTESSSFRSKSIDIIMNSLYEKSSREMHHSKRVSYLCEQIASNIGLSQEEIRECRVAGLVHDIGKIGVSNIILDKVGKLTNEEWAEMKKHSEMGYRILGSVVEFSEIADYVLSHQERWDGKGYPQALKGEKIPIQSRIIAVADSFDAMTVERSYRKAMSEIEAVQEIKKCAGTQFDPNIAKIFVEKVLGDTW